MTRKSMAAILLLCCLIIPAFSNGQGESNFPNRPVQNVFPWSPGSTYAASQVVANAMAENMGTTMSVTSTTGAGGVKAAMTVMSKPADGYTVFDAYVAPLILAPLFGKADYTFEDWKPLYGVASNAFTIVVRKDDERFPDLTALIEYAKAHPGELKYCAGGDVSLPHMAAASLLKNTGAVTRHVPYNDTNEGIKDMLAGELDFDIMNSGGYQTFKDDVRILAVLSDLPQPAFPGQPLAKDFGYCIGLDGLAATGWTWWVVHKDTPDDITEILRTALKEALDDPKVQKSLSDMGYLPMPTDVYSPENYTEECTIMTAQLKSALAAIEWEKEEIKKY
ncbi:MAG: tripartite tricarboxylate transporter substrate binding protein [Spirochaetales bacterium]|nr:tripartite tricarboxylate transporter substrate binding protein [Spirochaetales bacterium]